jgi:hypothetical protein
MMIHTLSTFAALLLAGAATLQAAEKFVLPTPNRAIFSPGREAEYYAPTPGRTWEAGAFGCVRTGGNQLHEGLDILHTKRDKRGEPLDEIYASAAGRVAYVNRQAGLSNYGRYIVLHHQIEGIPVYTSYAHLSEIADGLQAGSSVRQGQVIGIMGRSTNTRTPIGKDRAHLHFELCLRLNDRYSAWHTATLKGQRNDHGNWNGRSFVGIDPGFLFKQQRSLGAKFSLLDSIRTQRELCRVLVRDASFPWLRDYTPLVRRNPKADKEGVAGYEIVFNGFGLPYQLTPRSKGEMGSGPRIQLLSVNDSEQSANPCKKMVVKRAGKWQLTASGTQMIELLIY